MGGLSGSCLLLDQRKEGLPGSPEEALGQKCMSKHPHLVAKISIATEFTKGPAGTLVLLGKAR